MRAGSFKHPRSNWIVVFVLLTLAAWSSASYSGTYRDVLTLDASDIVLTQSNGFDAIGLRDGRYLGTPGQPGIPAMAVQYRVPSGQAIKSFTIVDAQWISLGVGFMPLPVQPNAKAGETLEFRAPEGEAYLSGAWYPSEALEYAGGGYLRGRRIEGFVLTPVRYRGQGGELEYLSRVEIEVELEDVDSGALTIGRAVKSIEDGVDAMVGTMMRREIGVEHRSWMETEGVLVEDAAGVEGGFVPSLLPDVEGSAVEYVIVTNDAMSGEFERLAEWKRSKGVGAVVKTIDWIEANYPNGVDQAETIRFFLQDAYANWGTIWVVLGGDSDVIPVRYVTNTYNNPGAEIPCDIYYSCLEGNWNDDGDEFFGEGYKAEAPGDSVDLYPDVFIGRVPANTVMEAQTYVDKLIQYEQAPDLDRAARALYFAEVLFPDNWHEVGGDPNFDGCTVVESAVSFLPPSMDFVKLYENLGNPSCPGGLLESKQAVIDSLNFGYGLAHHVGHGFINVMSVGDGLLLNGDADGLTNSNQASFVIALNCDAAAVDFNCIAENFLFNTVAVALVLGSAREDYPFTSQSYGDKWYSLVFEDNVFSVGEAFALSRVPFIPFSDVDNVDRWTQMVHLLLGDPEVPLWSADPESIAAVHSPTMMLGETSFDVTISSGGSPVESAYVALHKPGEAYEMGYTDEFGVISLPFSPDSLGAFTVVATKQNYVPYRDSVDVVSTVLAHMHATSPQVDDDMSGSSSGNGDGFPDRGETIEMILPLKNQGASTAYSVTATISTTDTMVTIIDGGSYHGNTNPGVTLNGDGYLIDISTEAPDRHLVTLDVSISSAGGSWSDVAVLELRAPDIRIYFSAKDDSTGTGNADAQVDPLEDIYLTLSLRNTGTGEASGLNALLRAHPDYGVTMVDSTSGYGDVLPDTPVPGDTFMYTNGDSANPVFTLLINDDYGQLDSLTIDMLPPPVVAGINGTGGPSFVLLKWSSSDAEDLRGYNIYRADNESGPYVRANDYTLESSSRYQDMDLGSLTNYFYKVAVQDTSGNEGPLSVAEGVSTAPPDQPGWPVPVSIESPSSPILTDIDRDGDYEICFGAEEIYVLHHDGSEFIDGDNDVRTLGVFSNTGQTVSRGFWSSPAVADIDRDNDMEIIANHMDGTSLYVWEDDGTVRPGWPKGTGALPWSTPAVGDIDGDPELEIITASGNKNIYAWNPDGTEVVDGDSNPSTTGIFAVLGRSYNYGSVGLADLDGDGVNEVIFGDRNKYLHVWNGDATYYNANFPLYLNAKVTTAPALVDVDNDGELEIIVAAGDQGSLIDQRKLHVYNQDGTEVGTFPKLANFGKDTNSSPAVGDVDANGLLDIVVADSDGFVYAWEGSTGTALPGWPIQTEAGQMGSTGYNIRSGVSLADVDGDGFLEVFFGDEGGLVYGHNHDGTVLAGFPIQLGGYIRGNVGLWDFDEDGDCEIIVQCADKNVYVWSYTGFFSNNADYAPWPFFKHDANRGCSFEMPALVSVDNPVLDLRYGTAGVELIWDVSPAANDVTGFNVYRIDGEKLYAGEKLSGVPDGYMKLNEELLGATGEESMLYLDSTVSPGGVYTYIVEQVGIAGDNLLGPSSVTAGMRGVTVAYLGQNYPNPFVRGTSIPYFIASPGSEVTLSIFDAKGRLVRKLMDGWTKPGGASINWDGRNGRGKQVPSGMYFYQLSISDKKWNRKMLLVR